METCKNCDVTLNDSYKYCPQCSQNVNLHRLSLHELFHEAVHYFTHADKGIFQLIRDLALQGGMVAKMYVNGKRKKFFPPLNFFLLVAAFHVFAISHGGDVERQSSSRQAVELQKIPDPVQRAQMAEIYHRKDTIVNLINKYANIVAMLTLPLTAFFFWLFYRKAKYNYTENLVACMYMHAFVVLLYSFILLLNGYFLHVNANPIYVVFFMMQISYFSWFYYRFQDKRGAKAALKAFVSGFMSVFLLFLINGILVWLYMLDLFH